MYSIKFTILLENLYRLEYRLEQQRKAAEALGIPFPQITISEPFKKEVKPDTSIWVATCTLEGEGIDKPVSLGTHSLVAALDHRYPQVIVNKVSRDVDSELLQRFEEKNVSYCEHCKKAIRRNMTFILEDNVDGTQKPFGGDCLRYYAPVGKSLEAIAEFYSGLQQNLFNNLDSEDPTIFIERKVTDTRPFVRSCIQIILAGYPQKSPNFDYLYAIVIGEERAPSKNSESWSIFEAYLNKRTEAEAIVDDCLAYTRNVEGGNDFVERMKRISAMDYFFNKDRSTMVWVASSYFRAKEREEQLSVMKQQSEWVGEKGEVWSGCLTYYKAIFLGFGEFGPMYLHQFKTDNGSLVVWRTNSDKEFKVGATYQSKGRISDYNVFEDVKQSFISRPRFVEVIA